MFSNKKETKQTKETGKESSHVGQGTVLSGSIETSENFRLDGKIIGELVCKAKVVSGVDSCVEGNIIAERAEISGEIKGDIKVSDTLILRPSARIHGDIITDKLIMDEGASFNGKCDVGNKAKEIKFNVTNSLQNKELSAVG